MLAEHVWEQFAPIPHWVSGVGQVADVWRIEVFYRIVERVFVFLLLLSSMAVVDALTRPAHAAGRDPYVISTDVPLPTMIIELGVYACGAPLVLMRWRRVLSAARAVWPLVALALLAPVSIAWSDEPMLTVRRSAFLLGSTLLGIYLGERFSVEQLSRFLAQSVCMMILATVIFYVVAPAYVIDYTAYGGAWKGLSVTKNTFGAYMAIAVSVLLLVRFHHFRWLRYLFLFTAALLLLLSHSATSLLGCVLIIAIMPLWRLIHLRGKVRLLVYLLVPTVICAGIYFICVDKELLFRVLERDSTLTGRTDLWLLVLSAIMKHPILGYGYGAFWTGMKGEVLNIYIASKWLPMGAHNGYLELCLSFGILGLPLLFYVIFRSFRMANDYIRSNDGSLGLWPMTYLILFVFNNFFESHLLGTRSLEFVMFVAITTSLATRFPSTESRLPRDFPTLLWAS
jgi:exopolysaccharide production protein ExoQ